MENFINELSTIKENLKKRDLATIIKTIALFFILRELLYLFIDSEYYNNTIDLWEYIPMIEQYNFFQNIIYFIGLLLLFFFHRLGWMLSSAFFLFFIFIAMNYAASSLSFLVNGNNNPELDDLYLKYGNFGSLFNELIMLAIFVGVLIYLWSKAVQSFFKIKLIHFFLVSILLIVLVVMYYFGYEILGKIDVN